MALQRRMFPTVISSGCPMVFKHAVDEWQSLQWTPECLCNFLGDKLLDCKISVIQHEDFQWEPDCLHVKIRMSHYVDWLNGKADLDNPLRLFDKTKYSCYIDYKYMKDLFKEQPHLIESISWEVFGLTDHGGAESTIWIGSCGTYTPCHQDTYGFNLVAQIQGRKRWYLFNPDQTDCMYPTRIPYEESSIYSEVNVRYPNLERHPMFQNTTPYVIELVPGDVLYVPRHWWHFVESLEASISINTWVPVIADAESQLDESVTRLLYTCLSTTLLSDSERHSYLNTGEELQSNEMNFHYLKTTLETLHNRRFHDCVLKTTEKNPDRVSQRQMLGSTKNTWQNFCDKFQDYTVNVVCLCGVDVHESEQHVRSAHRKRKIHATHENKGTVDDIINESSDQNEMKSKKRKSELGKNFVCRELNEKIINNEIKHYQVNTSNVSCEGMKTAGEPETNIEPGVERDATFSSGPRDDSACSRYSLSKQKTDKSLIEIYAAKSFTFSEYLKFLRYEFKYPSKSELFCGHNGSSSSEESFDKTSQVIDSENKDSTEAEPTIEKNDNLFDTRNTDISTGDVKEIYNEDESSNISTVDLVNSILDPDVIRHIRQVLLNKIKK